MQLNKHYSCISYISNVEQSLAAGDRTRASRSCGFQSPQMCLAQQRSHLPRTLPPLSFYSSISFSLVFLFFLLFPFIFFQLYSSHSPFLHHFCFSASNAEEQPTLEVKPVVERGLVRWLPWPEQPLTSFHVICTTLCQKAKNDTVCHVLEFSSLTLSFPIPTTV